jgi:hypothetical protein
MTPVKKRKKYLALAGNQTLPIQPIAILSNPSSMQK